MTHPPPPTLDGAHVLWWAWSGDTPFGEMQGSDEGDRWIYGFAICRYASGHLYRFSCNSRWEVINDDDHVSEEEAKLQIPLNYDASRVHWHKYTQP